MTDIVGPYNNVIEALGTMSTDIQSLADIFTKSMVDSDGVDIEGAKGKIEAYKTITDNTIKGYINAAKNNLDRAEMYMNQAGSS